MRSVETFVLFFVTSMALIQVHSKPVLDYRNFFLPDDTIRLKKRNADSSKGYLEQCGIVKFPNAGQGVVNVLAFLDSTWPYSHRQAIMLKMLNERLRRSGLPDTRFFVVNVDPSFPQNVDTAEDEVEREVWLGVSPEEIERFSELDRTSDSLAMNMDPDINLIQDNDELGIWKELRGSRDQVLIIDRCGKLTYQVIVPWSILHFPYVKAAILSTYKDEPCGPCLIEQNPREISTSSTPNNTVDITEETIITTTPENPKKITSSTTNDRKNLVPSTSQTATSSLFQPLDIATETSATARNLIVEDNYSMTASSRKNYEESTTSMISGTGVNDAENFDVIHPFTDSSSNTIPTTTENHFDTETIKTPEIQDKSNDSNNVKNVNDENAEKDTSMTIETIINTTTDKSVHSQIGKHPGVEEELLDTKNENNSLNQEEKNDTTTMIDNSIHTTMKEISDIPGTRFLHSEEQSSIPKTEENIANDSVTDFTTNEYSTMNGNGNIIDDIVQTTTENLTEFWKMPIRIIMHAPHFHGDGDSTRMHEYIVLKTGGPHVHHHLTSHDATRLYSGLQDFREKLDDVKETEDKKWSMKSLIFNKDESTGLYGEVADYWRDLGSLENYEDTEETERPEDERIAEEESVNESLWNKPSKTDDEKFTKDGSKVTTETTEKSRVNIASENVEQSTEEYNFEEEETRNKLIAHYSKLLPWIYYVLDK